MIWYMYILQNDYYSKINIHNLTCTIFFLVMRTFKIYSLVVFVQLPSRVRLFVTPRTAAHQASLSLTISRSLPKFMSIASMMPSIHLILWRPLILLPSILPNIRDFSTEAAGPPISRAHPYPHTQSNTATCWSSARKTPFPLAGDF